MAEAVDIQGWLELAWEDAPYLIVAGVNEGHLPESIRGDLFLPDTLRAQLGLCTNADRFARDAWLMELLLSSRAENGRVDYLVGRQRASGEPLKPSRLLFRCADQELPARVERLFAQLPPGAQPPAWETPWQLTAIGAGTVEHLSNSSICNYLQCPYRFYLRQVLKMAPKDFDLREMDAKGFGGLVHDVLDAFGKAPKARELNDAGAIYKFFSEELARQVEARFGRRPPLALRVQQEIAGRRLRHAAHVQAAEREAGWEIVGSEEKFEKELDGMKIVGRIDRIERNKKTGAVRVLDYKSSNKGELPAKKHWQRFKAGRDDAVPDYARFDLAGKEHVWLDLQLFLYAWALEEDYGTDLELGYFNLPQVGAGTGVSLLTPADADVRLAAVDCARGVVADVCARRFWPPAPKLKYDDFKDILFSQPELCAVEPKGVAV
jgi:ATP-dependent helicase/nuclease subunit B